MILQGPSLATVQAAIPAVTSAQLTVQNVTFDLVAHVYYVTYIAGGAQQTVSGAIPVALQTALENHALRVAESAQGWAPNSATVVTP